MIEGVPLFTVDGGAGDDVLEARGTANAIGLHGGPGDDRLIGGDGTDLLYGGPGRDQLTGGSGDDGLSGGSDVDDPSEADPSSCSEPDVIEGGPGRDSVGYGDHPCDVTVDLNRLPGLAGAADERDQVSGIEGASGGPGDDRLIGDGQWNQLSGRGGRDVVSGGDGDDLMSGAEGDDVLSGGAGHDLINDGLGGNVMEGGAGNDSLGGAGDLRGGEGDDRLSGTEDHNVFDGGSGDDDIYSAEFATEDQRRAAPPEFVRCGDGHDTVAPVDSSVPPGPPSRDVLIGCEQADLNLGPLIPLLPGGPIGRQVAMRLPCPKQFRGGCAYSVQIYRSGRRIGSGRGRVRRAREGRVGVRMRSTLPTGTRRRIRIVLKRRSGEVLERAAYTVVR